MNKEHKKIERMLLFSEVAEQLSYKAASKSLGISRGYLSEQVKTLEQDLGMPLLIRSTRHIRLTDEGLRLMQHIKSIRLSTRNVERHLKQERESIEGVIRVTSATLFAERFLYGLCSKFREEHPKVEFSIDCSYTPHNLNISDFDLAFRSTNTPPQDMIAQALLPYQHWLCASPKYLARNDEPEHPKDLHSHQCLRGHDTSHWTIDGTDYAIGGWLKINDNHSLIHQSRLGHGIVSAPSYAVEQAVRDGSLTRVLAKFPISKQTIHLIHPQLVHQSQKIKTFLHFVNSFFIAQSRAEEFVIEDKRTRAER